MGRSKQRRLKFLADNPLCCFCGGRNVATEEDHFPSRALFRERIWPEGFVFPACAKCNDATSRDELLVAWLARLRVHNDTLSELDRREFTELRKGIERGFPGLLDAMHSPSHRERRRARETYRHELPDEISLLEVPVLSGHDPRIHDAMNNVGRKLALAVYYRHFGDPLPDRGRVGIRWLTNAQIDQGVIPGEFAMLLTDVPTFSRAGVDLSEQFFYRYRTVEDGDHRVAVFFAGFNLSFGMIGAISNNGKSLFADPGQAKEFSPYDWA